MQTVRQWSGICSCSCGICMSYRWTRMIPPHWVTFQWLIGHFLKITFLWDFPLSVFSMALVGFGLFIRIPTTEERKRKMLLMMPSLKRDKSEKHCINRQLELCCYQVKAWGHIRTTLDSCPRRDTIILDRQHYKMPPIRQAVSQRSLPQPWACFFSLVTFPTFRAGCQMKLSCNYSSLFLKLQIPNIWMRQFAS